MPAGSSWQDLIQKVLCFGLTYPTAVIGAATTPYRGLDVFYARGGEWCDFCTARQELFYHLTFAIPVYVLVFYIPAALRFIARRDRYLFLRLVASMIACSLMMVVWFAVAGDPGDPRTMIRTAGVVLAILAISATIGWSRLSARLKIAGVGIVLVGSALIWTQSFPPDDRYHIGQLIATASVLAVIAVVFFGFTEALARVIQGRGTSVTDPR